MLPASQLENPCFGVPHSQTAVQYFALSFLGKIYMFSARPRPFHVRLARISAGSARNKRGMGLAATEICRYPIFPGKSLPWSPLLSRVLGGQSVSETELAYTTEVDQLVFCISTSGRLGSASAEGIALCA